MISPRIEIYSYLRRQKSNVKEETISTARNETNPGPSILHSTVNDILKQDSCELGEKNYVVSF